MFFCYAFVGFLVELAAVFLIGSMGFESLLKIPYLPWFVLGEILLPTPNGPASHAMGGVGGMLFALIGFLVYACLLGILIRKFVKARYGLE